MIRMKHLIPAALLALAVASPALADLPVGAKAPDFSAQGALAGKDFAFRLSEALKRGPVVLYFYPKAFTQGCTLEAHAFAAAMEDFHKAGASVLGLSADELPALEKFSTSDCGGKFPVASATPETIKAYDAPLTMAGIHTGLTSRTTYVIGRDGKITMTYTAMDWREHVPRALAAVKALAGK
jgi:peroxiredoxin